MVILPAPFFDDVAGDPVRVQLQVQDSPSGTQGTFNIVHLDDAGGLYAHIVGDVNCASIVDGVAFTTGIIRKAWVGGRPALDLHGTAAAITVGDGGVSGDGLGFSFEFFGRPIQPCQQQEVPPFLPVDSGNFTVRSGST